MKRDNNINKVFLPEAREVYKAPVIETVEVMVERGFQATGNKDESDSLGGGTPNGNGSW